MIISFYRHKERRIAIKQSLYIFLLVLFFAINFDIEVEGACLIDDGRIIFTTSDKKATSDIRWRTVGFTITRERCLSGASANGGYPTKFKHATIYLRDEWKVERESSSNIYVTFTIPQDVVSQALIKAGMSDIKNDDSLFLNGIFQVTHEGEDYGNKKYSLPAITSAESWANPDDFKDRFDVMVYYRAPDEPISIQYRTSSGYIMDTETYAESKWQKPGTKVSVSLDEQKVYKNKKYEIYKSYVRSYSTQKTLPGYDLSTKSGDSMEAVRKRTISQQIGGVLIVAVMKLVEDPIQPEKNIVSNWDPPNPHGVIAADARGNPIYDVEDGIPATESLYLNVFSKNYLFGYEFKNVTGEKIYTINLSKTYHLTWEEIHYDENFDVFFEKKSKDETVTKTVKVKRTYSYWMLEQLEYYKLKEAEIWNEALPDGFRSITPEKYSPPNLNYQCWNTEKLPYIKEPEFKENMTLPTEFIEGDYTCPEIPLEDFDSIGDENVDEIQVRNDSVSFQKTVISKGEWMDRKTVRPVVFQTNGETGKDVLYQKNIVIPMDTANGLYETSGILTYQVATRLNSSSSKEHKYVIEGLDKVNVHTPVVCEAGLVDQKAFNQMLHPDKERNALVLDREFVLELTCTGRHLDIKGYGLRNYDNYAAGRQVRFPFDVYHGSRFYPADSWVTIESESTKFYLPAWVKEGKYTIVCRVPSISAKANGSMELTEDRANRKKEHYVATYKIPVEVSGRIYGFQIRDISDYPLWSSVFRRPDSLEHSGVKYFAGIRNQDGIRRSDVKPLTVPLVKGSHPANEQAGITATGYTFRFSIDTVGEMYQDDDYVQLTPAFYFISKKEHKRQEVDLYYTEMIQNQMHTLVKIGSALDLKNIKSRYLGEPYTAVPEEELNEKRFLTGKMERELFYQPFPMFTFHHILLSEPFHTYIGDSYLKGESVPESVNLKQVSMARQRWYGEYYLPGKVYAVPKGFDLEKAEKAAGSFDFSETFWLKEGYLLIHFDIVSVKENERYLSYRNEENEKEGYCNMWNQEGFEHKKTDVEQEKWNFEEGDVFLYDLSHSMGIDYRIGGTH